MTKVYLVLDRCSCRQCHDRDTSPCCHTFGHNNQESHQEIYSRQVIKERIITSTRRIHKLFVYEFICTALQILNSHFTFSHPFLFTIFTLTSCVGFTTTSGNLLVSFGGFHSTFVFPSTGSMSKPSTIKAAKFVISICAKYRPGHRLAPPPKLRKAAG
jgi:hypothetical protein